MTDGAVPEWVKGFVKQHESSATERKAQEVGRFALEKAIKADGSEFCRQLEKELCINAEACKRIGATAIVEDLPRPSGADLAVKVRMIQPGFPTREGHIGIFREGSSSFIRCCPDVGSAYQMEFSIDARECLAVIGREGELLNAERVAASIVRALYERVTGETLKAG